jgi:cobalt-zinc-cadmium efflux system membrane fusion protein
MTDKSKRHLKIGTIALIVGITLGIIGWRRVTRGMETPDPVDERVDSPSDVVVVDEQQLKQISTVPVKQGFVTVDRKATGKIGFNEDRLTPVFTPYSGRVTELLVNKGDAVKAGQPLVVLESPDYVAAQNELASARSDVVKAKIGLKSAEVALERAQNLHNQEAISTKELQQSEADLARARDEDHRADATLKGVESRVLLFGKDPEDLANLGEHVDRRIVLRAPISGIIVDRKIGPGQYIKSDLPDPLFLISDLTTLWVIADVYESDVAAIRVNMPVEVSVAAYSGRVFPARISFISPAVDPATRTVRVRCLVPNSDGLLKPEMFATIKIGAAEHQQAPLVPASAIINDGDASVVFVAEGGRRFHRRPIHVGHQVEAGAFVVDSGLRSDEAVAIRGALLLNELRKYSNK